MQTGKKLLSLVLSGALALSLAAVPAAAAGMDNFRQSQTYTAGQFTDVSGSAWYAESVKTAYELGLVTGVSDTAFNPDGSITIGSTIALAARLHSIYNTGTASFTQGSPWYQVYVDYAVQNGIITAGQFSDYNANATRRQFAGILAKALPAEALTAINTVEDGAIPDVASGSANYAEIYTLYRAGVLTGNDAAGTFAPETTIGRSSVAAIVSRMASPALRQNVTLTVPEPVMPEISPSALSGARENVAEVAGAVQEGQNTLALVDENSFLIDFMGPASTITALAFGVAAVGFLDLAMNDLSGTADIPISYEGHTTLQSLMQTTREDLWDACNVDPDLVSQFTWRMYYNQASNALQVASGRVQEIQRVLDSLG